MTRVEKRHTAIHPTPSKKPRIVILGGGFAGLAAAKSLRGIAAEILLVDRQNHHLFQPLLYQVATAGLSAADIAQPLRHILAGQENCSIIMDEVVRINPDKQEVFLKDSSLIYDYLIVALGVCTGYFGHHQWARYAPGLKTLDEATEVRRRVLLAFEKAETAKRPDAAAFWLKFVVVGGGPTGVELAGAVAELARFVLKGEFKRIDPTAACVHLIEAGDRLLPGFGQKQSVYTKKRLQSMGVTVHLNSTVENISREGVEINGTLLQTGTVLWAAGVEGNGVAKTLGKQILFDRAGRVEVNPDLTVSHYRTLFVVGDLANATDSAGKKVPGVAPAASQMGKHAARQIIHDLNGRSRSAFRYFDKGSMATIGRSSGVTEFWRFALRGYIAWLAWLGVHLVFLLGMRNRITVFLHWVWSYVTWQRGARIITKKRPLKNSEP